MAMDRILRLGANNYILLWFSLSILANSLK